MIIKITGISGYLGKLVSNELTKNSHFVSGIKRELLYGPTEYLKNEINGSDVIINLAGAPIFQRWSAKNRQIIYSSRIKTTQNLVQAINDLPMGVRPKKFISASAIGIYAEGNIHDENSRNYDNGFVGTIVKDWENSINNLPDTTQKIIFRTGLVLGKEAITIKSLLLPFKLGLGATIGNGNQPFPFVHEKDVVNAFRWAVEKFKGNEVFNLVASEKITNRDFTKILAKTLHRPAFLCIPEIILKLIYGKAADMITKSPGTDSKKIVEAGFTFSYPTIESALSEIILQQQFS